MTLAAQTSILVLIYRLLLIWGGCCRAAVGRCVGPCIPGAVYLLILSCHVLSFVALSGHVVRIYVAGAEGWQAAPA